MYDLPRLSPSSPRHFPLIIFIGTRFIPVKCRASCTWFGTSSQRLPLHPPMPKTLEAPHYKFRWWNTIYHRWCCCSILAPCCLRFRMGKKESEKRVVQEEEEQEEDAAWRMCCFGDIRNLGSYMSDICTFVIVYNYRAAVVAGAVGAFRGSGPFWAWLGGKRNNNVIKKSLRKRWRASRSLGGKKVRSCIKHAPGIMWYYALVCLPLWDVAGHMRRQLRRRRRKHLVYF